jgi:hypothetical protein
MRMQEERWCQLDGACHNNTDWPVINKNAETSSNKKSLCSDMGSNTYEVSIPYLTVNK